MHGLFQQVAVMAAVAALLGVSPAATTWAAVDAPPARKGRYTVTTRRYLKHSSKHASESYSEFPWESPARRKEKFAWPSETPPNKLSTMVVASLAGGSGDMCKGQDWRGELPKYIAHQNPDAVILIWSNARQMLTRPVCDFCTPHGLARHTVDCDDWMKAEQRTADAVLIIGQGAQMCRGEGSKWGCAPPDPEDGNEAMRREYTGIYNILIKPWMRSDTWTTHIPVSDSATLQRNRFNLSRVVLDSDFPKPPTEDSQRVLHGCATTAKQNNLIYPARYSRSDHKGQQAFLRKVPPKDLEGYTIHFFGANLYEVEDELTAIAASRGIRIKLHELVPQLELMEYICRAKGTLLFSKSDANPRVAYEGFPAGNPMYLSSEVTVPDSMKQLPFVFSDSRRTSDVEMPGFHAFMAALRNSSSDYHRDVRHEAMKLLHHDAVYHSICMELGLCHALIGVEHQTQL